MSVVAVDLGGTKTTAGLVRDGASVRFRATAPTPATSGPDAVLATVVSLVERVRADAARDGVPAPQAVGIGSAGVIGTATGTVVSATDALAGWAGTPVAARVASATGLPVIVLNDVHAHALGEARYGAGHGLGLVLVVAAGTGVGGAVVAGGRLLTGAHDAAGHLGHVPSPEASGVTCPCGGAGHLEGVASGPGIVAAYHRLGGAPDHADLRAVAAAAGAGDALAVQAVAAGARALGRAIGGWVNALDPHVVVLTGGVAGLGPAWWTAVRSAASREYVPAVRGVGIVPARLRADAALVGAASYVVESGALGNGASRSRSDESVPA